MALSSVDIGACQVTFAGVDLGNTLDGVLVTADRKFVDLLVDKYGDTPIDKALLSQGLWAKFKLAEPTAKNLQVALPEGDHEFGVSGSRIGIGRQSGYLLSQNAGLLVLRPLRNVASGTDKDDINVYSAVSTNAVALPYQVKNQRVIEITMEALVNEAYSDGRRLGHIGPSIIS